MSSSIISPPFLSVGREVAFVDSRVEDIGSLLQGLGRGVEVVRIDATQDGLAQMAAALGEKGDVAAVHVLAHGSAGSLLLGSTVLDSNLADHSEPLAALGRAMAPHGDLLVYACDLAAGEAGAQFVSTLARLTGADVAASTDLTGAAALGGNWALESHTGSIEAQPLALTGYGGVLDVLSFVYGVDSNGATPTTSIAKTASGHTITFSGPEIYIYDESPNDALYPYVSAGGDGILMTVAVEAGYSFDISAFDVLAESGSIDFSITWANGTTSSYTQSGVNDQGSRTTLSSFDTALNDMRSITITSTEYTSFQNFNITDVKLLPPLPPTTVVNSASLSDDTGSSGTDFITNLSAQTISGALSANLANGEKVEVSYNNGGLWSDATTYVVGTKAWSTTTALSGSSTFMARVSNASGPSTAYSHTYTVDTVLPTNTFSSIALSADTGVSNTDFITRTASQTISATIDGALAGDDKVWGSTDGGAIWTDITNKVSGTTVTWNGATLGAGSIMFKVSDAAGNDSSLSFQNYTLDTTQPATTVATISFSGDSGTSSSDFITNMASQTVSGTLSANMVAGDTVYVSLNNGATWSAATAAVGQTNWSLGSVSLSTSSTLMVKVSDTAGNDGTVRSQAYTYDTTVPTTTFSGLSLLADTGASNTDFITKTASQTIGATLSAPLAGDDILYGSLDNGAHWTDITSKVSGTTLSWTGATLTGSNTLQLKVVDAAGNPGSPQSKAYTLDTSIPVTPGLPDLATASDTGSLNNDNITLDTTPTLSGTAEIGSTVTLYDGVTMLGTVVAGAGGWTYTTGVLTQGGHTITAVSADTAGNVSAASVGLTITVDTSAPTVTSVAVPGNGTYYSGGALDFTVNFSEAVIVDDFGGTPRIELTVGATTRYADYLSGSGTSALLFRYTVPNGDIEANGIAVNALSANGGLMQDAAGNDIVTTLNSVGSTAAINVDGTQPSVTGVSANTSDGSYGAGQTIAITVDFSSAVTVDTTGGTPTLALDGGGIATYTGGSGSSTLAFSYVVGAGQNSADLDYSATSALVLNGATIIETGGAHQNASLVLATPGTAGSLGANKGIVIDTAAPSNTVAGAGFSADTGTSGSDFITYTAAQTISGTLASNLAVGEKVSVSLDNGGSWALAAAAAGTWSLTGQTLTGSGTLKVRVTDDAGNHGTAYSHTYVLDTTAPAPNGPAGTPADNAAAAPTTGAIVLPFMEALDAVSDLSKVYLKKVGTPGNIAATVTLNGSGHLVLTPATALADGGTYYVNWDANALKDAAGNAAVAVTNDTTYNFTTAVPNSGGGTPPGTPIDGVPVVTEPGPGGSTVITIPVVVPTRPDTPGTPSPLADIPLVTAPDGHPILQVSVPTGVGLQAEGLSSSTSGTAALAELGFRIERVTGNSPELTNAGQVFFATLAPNEPLTVQILKPTTGAGYNPNVPLVISGSASDADGKQAIILDARSLPSGTVIQVDNIDFIAVVGNVRLIGGAGQNAASGDGAAQWIVLGPDDDIIHGGGGNDTIGSLGGDDQLYGDAGDDIVFGGEGNDLLSGGTGSDRLNGGTGFDVAIQEGKKTDYTVTLEGSGIRLTHTATGVSDWLVDVEQVRFATGPSLTVAHSAAEEAAAFLFQKWIGRDLSQAEGSVIQTLTGKTALEVATLFAQVFPQQSAGKTPAQLLEGMADAGAVRVDAIRDVTVIGDSGNNTITPMLGLARYVDGSAGIDTLVIPATLAQTHLQANGGGTFTLQRMTDGAMLDLTSVERVRLSDTQLALDLNGHAGEAAKLLGALGGPAILGNKALVGEVIRALDAGVSSQALAGIGLQALGAQTPSQVAQLLWTNVVGRAGTQAELQPLVNLLGQGVTASDLAVMAGNLDLTATRIDLVGLAAKGIEFA